MFELNSKIIDDEFIIRKAKIYKVMGENDDRLQVQPLPEFMGLNSEELENLPIFPMLEKGTMITGDSVVENKEKAEHVIVICNKDFSIGYILCKANQFHYGTKEEKFPSSYNYKSLKEFLINRKVLPDNFEYQNLIITQFFGTDKGGMFQGYNRKTGDWFLVNSSGTVLTVQQKDIFMRVGSPPEKPELGPVGFSMLHLTPDRIFMKSPNIEIDAQDLVLGKHGLKLVGTLSSSPIIGRNGIPAMGIPEIHV